MEPNPVDVATERLRLFVPPPTAAARIVAFYVRNAAHFASTDPPRPAGFHTVEHWRLRLAGDRDELARGLSMRLKLAKRDDPDGPIIGSVSFNSVIRGPLSQCFLGYGLDASYEGLGYMTEALRAAVPLAFERLRIHRICANHLPTNERSARVLRRLGFAIEGYARDYLFIDGAWRDHVMTALVDPSGRPPDPG